jgi:AraC-like DNA-binding protein
VSEQLIFEIRKASTASKVRPLMSEKSVDKNNENTMTKLITSTPKLYIWTDQLLFLGAAPIYYREHVMVSDRLIVSINNDFQITLASGEIITSKTMLIKAGTKLEKDIVNMNRAVIAIYYLAPLTQDYHALESIMPFAMPGLHYNHPEEALLIKTLLSLRDTSTPPEQTFSLLRKFIVQPHLAHRTFKEFDERIIEVVHQIRATVGENLSLKKFADDVYLSESRLEKLFKEHMGIPITRYRLRYRVFIGTIHLALSQSITKSALTAGFASPAHFSKSFSAINGIPPSSTFFKPPCLEVLISDEAFSNMSRLTN